MFGRNGEVTDAIVYLKPLNWPAFRLILNTIRRFAFPEIGDLKIRKKKIWSALILHRRSGYRKQTIFFFVLTTFDN